MKKLLLIGNAADKLAFIQKLREQSCNSSVNPMRSTGMDLYKLKINNEDVCVWLTKQNEDRMPAHTNVNIVILVTPHLKIESNNQLIIRPKAGETEIDCVIRAADIKPVLPRQLIKKLPTQRHLGLLGIITDLLTKDSMAQPARMQEIVISTRKK